MSLEASLQRLTEFVENWQRTAPQLGLAFAEVAEVTEQGQYVLTYKTGHRSAPSSPARMSTFMAGGGRGGYFMPEIGDEVVVGFEMGDLDRPVILGSLWNDEHTAPSQADDPSSNNIRTIVSRAGHEITFDDSPGGKIMLRTRGGFEITLEDGPNAKLRIKTTGATPSSQIVLEDVSWNHYHPTGTGPSGGPVSMVPV